MRLFLPIPSMQNHLFEPLFSGEYSESVVCFADYIFKHGRCRCFDRPVNTEDDWRQHKHRDMDSYSAVREPSWPHLRRPSGLRGPGGRDSRHNSGTSVFGGHHHNCGGPGLHYAGLWRWELHIYRLAGTLQETEESDQLTHRQLGNIRLSGGDCVLPLSGGLLRGQAAVVGSWDCALCLH